MDHRDNWRREGFIVLAGIFALLPQAILGPLGGLLADRYSRRLIMICSDLITAFCMIILIYLFSSNSVQIWHVYSLLFVRSSMQAFQGPASQSSTVMLVPSSFLPRAAGLNQITLSLMTIAAAPVGAFAIGVFSFKGALMIDVVTAVLGIMPLLIFKVPQPVKPEDSLGPWTEFKQGIHLVWNSKPLRQLYSLQGFLVFVLMPCFTLVPLLVTQHFKSGIEEVALMEGLAGAAMLFGGIVVTMFTPKRKIVTYLMGFALSSYAVTFTALATKETFTAAVFFWVVSGFVFTYGNTPIMAVLQKRIPPHLQGRAFSLLTMTTALAAPIGLALFGPIGSVIGIQNTYIYGGIIAGSVCVLSLFSKELRKLEHPEKV